MQTGSHKNTVANIFIYRKRRVLDVFCLFLESTRFPKKNSQASFHNSEAQAKYFSH